MTKFLSWLIVSLPVLSAAASALLCARRLLHYFQLESYQFYGYFKTIARQWKKTIVPFALLGILFFGLSYAIAWMHSTLQTQRLFLQCAASVLASALIAAIGCFTASCQRKTKEKKPFVMTARMKRLYAVLAVVTLGFCLISAAFVVLMPLLTALSALIALPLEKGIQRMYMRDAQRKMDAQTGLIRIGITGSYGKTSVKTILNTLLSQKYNVLIPPASFNTPMGLTRVIRERLEPAHQVFIAEMGARHRKDIKELTDFIHPTIGVLVSVGPQHLDTFKTMENIIDTKYDLIRALPDDGFAAFSDDGGVCADLYAKTTHVKKAITNRTNGDVWAEDMRLSNMGSTFTLCFADGKRLPCNTRLLGAHNIGNILLCVAVAKHLGLSDAQLQRGISLLQPVEHRLQLIPSAGGVTIIDDAFNSNPRGSKAALDVFSRFPGRRIIVTPGMVELGQQEAAFNREFGCRMAQCADVCVLIGKKHTLPIQDGLRDAGFNMDNMHVFASLAEATAWLRGFMQAGDYVLYENDLPDHYTEN